MFLVELKSIGKDKFHIGRKFSGRLIFFALDMFLKSWISPKQAN